MSIKSTSYDENDIPLNVSPSRDINLRQPSSVSARRVSRRSTASPVTKGNVRASRSDRLKGGSRRGRAKGQRPIVRTSALSSIGVGAHTPSGAIPSSDVLKVKNKIIGNRRNSASPSEFRRRSRICQPVDINGHVHQGCSTARLLAYLAGCPVCLVYFTCLPVPRMISF